MRETSAAPHQSRGHHRGQNELSTSMLQQATDQSLINAVMAEGDDAVGERALASQQYQYPFAGAPDIIRSHQKDAYFQAVLFDQLSTILRNVKGARFVHSFTTEARTAADLIYLALTTFVGNRTLGEEYCDIVQVEGETGRLPSAKQRGGYILSTILLPYALTRILPALRRRVRASLEPRLNKQEAAKGGPSRLARAERYILEHIDTITSPSPFYALSIAIFYFSGAYYHLSKRLLNLRYIFTRTHSASEQRAGYEVLGVLLVLQFTVQAYMHLHQTISSAPGHSQVPQLANAEAMAGTSAVLPGEVEVSLDPNAYSSNNALLFSNPESNEDLSATQRKVAHMTHTPNRSEPHFDLEDKEKMKWLHGRQARKCTLCLEPMKDPSATTCGHLFCWTCICDWCREKPECPLCRQHTLVQHILPVRE